VIAGTQPLSHPTTVLLATERSFAIESSSRTKPWSRTRIASSAMTRSVVATAQPSLVVTPADIAAHWGLRLAAPLEPIPAATNVVLRSGPYVVRSERRSVKSVLWEHDLLGFLAADVPEVVAPIPARDGTTFLARGRSVVSVFPYVEGRHMSRTGARVRAQLPPLLGRIHARAAEWPVRRQRPGQPSFSRWNWETNLWWDWSLVEPSRVVETAFARAREWVANAPPLTRCAIHGDFNPGNVLAVHGRPVAVLDWSAARLDWAAYDLACVVGLLALERDGSIDREVADRALAAYAEAGGPGEHDALVPLLRLFLLAVALFSLTRRARGESWNPQIVALVERGLAKLG
jgi:Ser/Thr protein kinase RdoA (MazF antagonist)